MNYYEHHLGDYAKDTTHLTMLEHGAYRLLMDRYYGTEKPIPQDQAYRVARANTKEERKAVDAVLNEFFTLIETGWNQRRINAEIAKMQSKVKAAQENGRLGGRPRKAAPGSVNETQKKPTGFPPGYENKTQEKALQSPVTNHQSPNTPTDVGVARTATPAGEACMAMRQAGLADVNPSHPKLTALLDGGISVPELVDAARHAAQAGKSFAYALATAEGRRSDAAKVVLVPPKTASKHAGFDQLDYSKGVNPDGSLAL